jgi:WD40 repeat protein
MLDSSPCRTAIVWSSSYEQVQVLNGHEQTVWAVKAISPTQILTGSADKTIILWTKSADKWTQTQKVRIDRSLSLIPSREADWRPSPIVYRPHRRRPLHRQDPRRRHLCELRQRRVSPFSALSSTRKPADRHSTLSLAPSSSGRSVASASSTSTATRPSSTVSQSSLRRRPTRDPSSRAFPRTGRCASGPVRPLRERSRH